VPEQAIEVLERVFGFSCGFETKFHLHFIDVHRYVSPVSLVVYLAAADKYRRLTQRLSQEQKGLDERVLMVSQWPSHLW